MRRASMILALVTAVAAGCRSGADSPPPRPPAPAPAASPEPRLARALPETAPPFVAGPLMSADGYVRRTYSRGDHRIEVTIAGYPMGAGGYPGWVQQSRGYPQATLDVPPDSGSGFYTCSGTGEGAPCDLHIQLRAGFHLEILGGSKATRADIEQLLPSLPLRTLAREGR